MPGVQNRMRGLRKVFMQRHIRLLTFLFAGVSARNPIGKQFTISIGQMRFNQPSFPFQLQRQFLFGRQVKHILRCENLLAVIQNGILRHGFILSAQRMRPMVGLSSVAIY